MATGNDGVVKEPSVSKSNAANYFSPQERRSDEPRPRLTMSYELSIARLRTRGRPEEDQFYSEPKLRVGDEEDHTD